MSNMNYSSVANFFNGAYLDIRHGKVLTAIKTHCDYCTRDLLAYLNNNEGKISVIERTKVNAFINDLQEVFFMCENLHMYINGMDKISSNTKDFERKTVEIKNQGQWIARHLPGLWDAVMIFLFFDRTYGQHLNVHPVIKLHYFSAINLGILQMVKAPFSYFKLKSVIDIDVIVSGLLAGSLAVASMNAFPTEAVDLTEESGTALAKVQAYNQDKITLSALALLKAYEKAMLQGANMGENEEVLRLIDELELSLKHLIKDYEDAFAKLKETRKSVSDGNLSSNVYDKTINGMVSKFTEILKKRLSD